MIHPQFAAETAARVAASAYPADPEKAAILSALTGFASQRPGLEYANYGDPASYRAESRAITRDLHHVYTLLRRVLLAPSITSDDLKDAFRAFSGRLTWDGQRLDYTTGQYFPTEYRRAVSALLAAGYWLAVCQGDEDEQPASRYKRDIMNLLGECDEDRIIVYSPSKGRVGWVYLVYGNDNGETVITDYTTNLEPQLQAVNAYAETLV